MYNLVSKINSIKNNKILLCILGFVILYLSFYKNMLHGVDRSFFKNFQLDSEALVLANAFKDKEEIEHRFSNLGSITMKGTKDRIKQDYIFTNKKKESTSNVPVVKYENKTDKDSDNRVYVDLSYLGKMEQAIGYQIVIGNEARFVKDVLIQDKLVKISYFGDPFPQKDNSKLSLNFDTFGKKYTETSEYTSQYGLQGQITSFLFNKLNLSIKTIQKLNVIVFSFVILGLTWLFNRIFSKNLAACFFISVIFSPWVVSFARNLYWIEFSWFLPAIFSWLLFIRTNKTERFFLYLCIYLSCWFKCLSGYEYFSSVLLFAVAPYSYTCLMSKTKKEFMKNLSEIIKIGIVGVLGFISALMMHAYLRTGGNISEGISVIWHRDVLRRTFGGNIKDFAPVYAASLNATPFDVLHTYISNWRTPVINLPILKDISLKLMLVLSFIAVIVEYIRGDKKEARHNLSLIIAFIIPAISWYVLGKSHSFIHTHMNYVLWYMGGIASMIYIIFKEILIHIKYEKELSKLLKNNI